MFKENILTEHLDLIKNYINILEKPHNKSLIFTPDLENDVKINLYEYIPDTIESYDELIDSIYKCCLCPLSKIRNKPVIGKGNLKPLVMFIGESPKKEDDTTGFPFSNELGTMLNNIITKVLFLNPDKEVYITNIVKCLTENDKKPKNKYVELCRAYLIQQINLLKPKVICTLGNTSTKSLLNTELNISQIHGKKYFYNNIPVVPTLHPLACIMNPTKNKSTVFNDMKKLKIIIDRIKGE